MSSKVVYSVCRYALGALFVFSGFAKGVNPFGLSLQFDSYFTAMGLEALAPWGPLASVVLPAAELWLGLLLLFGLGERITRWAVGAAMLFFTGLTLWIALENPVEDCGCFGELWKISNWATFGKNVVFLALAVLFFLATPRKPKGSVRWKRMLVGVGLAAVSAALPLWCWANVPLVETSPWAVGRNIPDQMYSTLNETAEAQVVYRDRTTGVERLFDLSDTTWQDDARWEYVRTDSRIERSGDAGPLADVAILDPRTDDNVADLLFGTAGTVVLVVAPDPRAMSQEQAERLCRVVDAARAQLAVVTCLTSTPGAEIPYGLPYLMADRSLLYAMLPNRVGGIMVLENGTVVRKSPF